MIVNVNVEVLVVWVLGVSRYFVRKISSISTNEAWN
jgi:hypothetical protein